MANYTKAARYLLKPIEPYQTIPKRAQFIIDYLEDVPEFNHKLPKSPEEGLAYTDLTREELKEIFARVHEDLRATHGSMALYLTSRVTPHRPEGSRPASRSWFLHRLTTRQRNGQVDAKQNKYGRTTFSINDVIILFLCLGLVRLPDDYPLVHETLGYDAPPKGAHLLVPRTAGQQDYLEWVGTLARQRVAQTPAYCQMLREEGKATPISKLKEALVVASEPARVAGREGGRKSVIFHLPALADLQDQLQTLEDIGFTGDPARDSEMPEADFIRRAEDTDLRPTAIKEYTS